MQGLQNRNLATLVVAVLGALKLILQAFGIDIITSQQIDVIANGVAAVITVAGVIMTHLKKHASSSNPPGAEQTDADTGQNSPTITHSARSDTPATRRAENPVPDTSLSDFPVSR